MHRVLDNNRVRIGCPSMLTMLLLPKVLLNIFNAVRTSEKSLCN